MYDDDLTTLMLEASETLVPPPAAAARALRSAAKSRKRRAVISVTGGVAAISLVAAGIVDISAGHGAQQAFVGSQPTTAATATDYPKPADESSSYDDENVPAAEQEKPNAQNVGPDQAFNALTVPNALPDLPVNATRYTLHNSFREQRYGDPGHDNAAAYPYQRTWGWSAAPDTYVPIKDLPTYPAPGAATDTTGHPVNPGYSFATVHDGAQVGLTIIDKADQFVESAGKVAVHAGYGDTPYNSYPVIGSFTLRGQQALLEQGKLGDSGGLTLTLNYGNYSIEATGGNGATVDQMVSAIDSIEGLDGTGTDGQLSAPASDSAPSAYATVSASPAPSPDLPSVSPAG